MQRVALTESMEKKKKLLRKEVVAQKLKLIGLVHCTDRQYTDWKSTGCYRTNRKHNVEFPLCWKSCRSRAKICLPWELSRKIDVYEGWVRIQKSKENAEGPQTSKKKKDTFNLQYVWDSESETKRALHDFSFFFFFFDFHACRVMSHDTPAARRVGRWTRRQLLYSVRIEAATWLPLNTHVSCYMLIS